MCVIGKISAHIADHPNVVKIPFAEDIGPYYAQSTVAICPILSGTGITIKVVEAMTPGLPVVCTPRGTDGLPDKINNGCLTGGNPHELARNLTHLIENHENSKEQSN